jgi:hypothetical protein
MNLTTATPFVLGIVHWAVFQIVAEKQRQTAYDVLAAAWSAFVRDTDPAPSAAAPAA